MSLLLPDSGLIFWMLLSFGIVFAVLANTASPSSLRWWKAVKPISTNHWR